MHCTEEGRQNVKLISKLLVWLKICINQFRMHWWCRKPPLIVGIKIGNTMIYLRLYSKFFNEAWNFQSRVDGIAIRLNGYCQNSNWNLLCGVLYHLRLQSQTFSSFLSVMSGTTLFASSIKIRIVLKFEMSLSNVSSTEGFIIVLLTISFRDLDRETLIVPLRLLIYVEDRQSRNVDFYWSGELENFM